MKHCIRSPWTGGFRALVLSMSLFLATAARAQLVADGATNTLSNVTNTITGGVTVGTNGTGTLLVLSSNALLTNSGNGVIGFNVLARSNEVRLASGSARWQMGGTLFVGSNGLGSRLVVSNGAVVENSSGTLGFRLESSNNLALVTGGGSLWSTRNNLDIGGLGRGNQMIVSNGGWVVSRSARLGVDASSTNNLVLVTGSGSVWSNALNLSVGNIAPGNRLVIEAGGLVNDDIGLVGDFNSASNNEALVTGPGSLWINRSTLTIGGQMPRNRLVVSNGAAVWSGNATIGASFGNNNSALLTGAGTLWSNQNDFVVGSFSFGNQLVVSNGATLATSTLFVGVQSVSTNNRVVVDGGTLRVTNVAGNGTLDVRRGTNVLNTGLIEVDRLFLTNHAQSAFEFNGGTLSAGASTVADDLIFFVGSGQSSAVLHLAGNGTHSFAQGFVVRNNGVLTGNGTISSTLLVSPGGTVAPGNSSVGKIAVDSTVALQGTAIMEISKDGAVLTNDQIQAATTFAYSGALTVTKLGPTALAAGDRFQLFPAGSTYSGAFTTFTLPPLNPGLSWTLKLLVDGSIEVFGLTAQTLPATAIGRTNATLNGVANPAGNSATVWFEYGFSTNYDNATAPQALGNGVSNTNFNQIVTGLIAGATYHFRAVASNIFGLMFGGDQSLPIFAQEAYVKTIITQSSAQFGSSVAMSDDTIVVGAQGEFYFDGTFFLSVGAAYVFVRNGTNWSQQAYLRASNPGNGDEFGWSVAISGDTIVVGAGFEESNATGVNGDQSNNSTSRAGAAYVFVRNGTNWTQQAYLKAADNVGVCSTAGCVGCICFPGDVFGYSVAVSGDTIVVGAPLDDSNATGVNGNVADNSATNAGAAYVFVRSGTNWSQQAYLKASNTGQGDGFGISVALSGETVVIGASGEDSSATGVNGDQGNNAGTQDSGAAYVFVRSGTNWSQQAYLKASNTGPGDAFGGSVAMHNDTVVVGASGERSNATGVNGDGSTDNSPGSGAAYVFLRSGTNWSQQAYLKASNNGGGDFFAFSVAVHDDLIVVGAQQEDSGAVGVNGDGGNNSVHEAGAAYVFVRSGTNWSQPAYLKASNTGSEDFFGTSVALAGQYVVVGAPFEDSNATGINGDQNNNFRVDSGAAYIFSAAFLPTPVLTIVGTNANQVTLSWTPPTPGFALQESLSLSPVSWSNSPSGETNPITLPATGQTKFFRLFKP